MNKRPNILLFCTDTLRTDALRFMGNQDAVSPNADRLACEGIWFNQAYTCSPVCSPARTSLLTGVYPPIHECLENGMGRREDLDTFVEKLNESGYHSIMAGKQHFGDCPAFDEVIKPNAEELERLAEAGEYSEDRAFSDASKIIPDAFVVKETIDAIARVKDGDQPFFVFCSLDAPHTPLQPPQRWLDKSADGPLPEMNRKSGEEKQLPDHLRQILGLNDEEQAIEGFDKEDPEYWEEALGRSYDSIYAEAIDQWRRRYYAYAAYADELLGRILDYLDEANLAEETVVIFTTDHGQQYFDHGFNDKHCWYDESWRVPFVIRHSGKLNPRQSQDFVSWMDIPATLVGIAGVEWNSVQGYDIYHAMLNESVWSRSCATGVLLKSLALVTQDWKLEYYLEEGIGRLFDREGDPQEQCDLWESSRHRELRNELLIELLRWRSDLLSVGKYQDQLLAEPASQKEGTVIVAHRVAESVVDWKGTDPEDRLNRAILEIEKTYMNLSTGSEVAHT